MLIFASNMIDEINKINELISCKKKIVITTHRSPDGDALGSSLALYNLLISLDHDCHVIVPNDYAKFLSWLPGNNDVIIYKNEKEKSKNIIKNTELIIILDLNNLNRLGEELSIIVGESNSKKILIDHHQDPDNSIADIIISKPDICSTGEIVFDIISKLKLLNKVNTKIAKCLYVAIMTDTGSFKYRSTSSHTHLIVSKLISYNIEHENIHSLIYDSNSINRIKLLGYCLNEKLLLFPENKSAIISLTERELNEFNFQKGDTEGIVNYPLSIKNIIFSILIVEKDGVVKLSLRSKGGFKVNTIAKKYFNGGGHTNASGGISYVSVNDTINVLKKIIKTI